MSVRMDSKMWQCCILLLCACGGSNPPATAPASPPTPIPAGGMTAAPDTRPPDPAELACMLAAAPSETYVRHIEMARADLAPKPGETARGTITFTPTPRGMYMEIEMWGLSPGEHMFHVHEYGTCTGASLADAGPHFSPLSLQLGAADRDPALMHLWHLGFLQADDRGYAKLTRIEPHRTFEGTNSILGRSVVVHDLNMGPRISCGIIGAVKR